MNNTRLINNILAEVKLAIPTEDQLASPDYARTSEATGVDLVLEGGQDLATDHRQDLLTVTGVDLIRLSFLRRITTNVRGYARYIEDAELGAILIDGDFGTKVYNFLANPLTQYTRDSIRQAVLESAATDPRILVESVSIVPIDSDSSSAIANSLRGIQLHLTYRIKSNSQLFELDTTIDRQFILNGES